MLFCDKIKRNIRLLEIIQKEDNRDLHLWQKGGIDDGYSGFINVIGAKQINGQYRD